MLEAQVSGRPDLGSDDRQADASAARFVAQVLGLLTYRLSCDYFGWVVATKFGIYGLEAKGMPFSELYWASMLVLLPIALVYARFVNRAMDLFDTGLALLFIASYVPLTTAWWICQGPTEYLAFASVFWMLLLAMVPAVKKPRPALGEKSILQQMISVGYAALVLLLAAAILARFGLPTDFGFDSVYNRRKEFSDWLPRGPAIYVFSWSVYVFCAYLLFVSRSWVYKAISIGFILLIFAASGDKIYALVVPVLLFALVVVRRNLWVFVPPLAAIGVTSSVWLFMAGELWVPSLIERILFLPADIAFHYVERFPDKLVYGYSFLSSFFEYREVLLPSFVIGKEFYSGVDNATANFLVDNYVNLGWAGLVVLLAFFVSLRRWLASGPHLIVLLPMFLQLLDTALPTTLLTGGGIIMIGTAVYIGHRKHPAGLPATQRWWGKDDVKSGQKSRYA